MKTVSFSIKSLSPLLMNSTKAMERDGGAKGVSTKKIPSAIDEAAVKAYRDEEGFLYVPCIFFRQAMVSAGKGRKIGKFFATTLIKGSVIDPDRKARLVDPETGEFISEYGIDERPVVVGSARVMRARPRVERWACDVMLDVDEEVFSAKDMAVLVDVLNMAGSRIGVGDYRVEKGGWFGRFEVVGWQMVEE